MSRQSAARRISADEARLDGMSADSFPASDPPSFTPVTHIGGTPEGADWSERHGGHRRTLLAAGALFVLGSAVAIAIIGGTKKARARKSVGDRIADGAGQIGHSAASIVTPLARQARSAVESRA